MDISAGGVCLSTQDEVELQEEDYVRLSGNVEILPIDLNGLIGQATAFEDRGKKEGFIIHVRFLSYEHDLRRQIIRLVYEKEQTGTPTLKSEAKTKSSARKKEAPQPQAGESHES